MIESYIAIPIFLSGIIFYLFLLKKKKDLDTYMYDATKKYEEVVAVNKYNQMILYNAQKTLHYIISHHENLSESIHKYMDSTEDDIDNLEDHMMELLKTSNMNNSILKNTFNTVMNKDYEDYRLEIEGNKFESFSLEYGYQFSKN